MGTFHLSTNFTTNLNSNIRFDVVREFKSENIKEKGKEMPLGRNPTLGPFTHIARPSSYVRARRRRQAGPVCQPLTRAFVRAFCHCHAGPIRQSVLCRSSPRRDGNFTRGFGYPTDIRPVGYGFGHEI
jgi:hypothetical protein